jgi:hypothetical protein
LELDADANFVNLVKKFELNADANLVKNFELNADANLVKTTDRAICFLARTRSMIHHRRAQLSKPEDTTSTLANKDDHFASAKQETSLADLAPAVAA